MEILQNHIKDMDFVISTAAVPGKRAPLLITSDMVNSMRPGSVIIDLAAETGGNCELTHPGETYNHNEVIVSGPLNVPSSMPLHASQLYSRNIYNLLMHIMKEDSLEVDSEDEPQSNKMEFSLPERSFGLTVSTIMLVIAGLILFMVTPIIGALFLGGILIFRLHR